MEFRKLFEKKPTPGKPEHADDATFTTEVLGSTLPVLVDFWAPWCAPCRLVGGLLEEIGPQYAGRMRIIKVDVDESPATATRYGIQSIPTMILFSGGKPVDQVTGALPLNPLKGWLERNLRPVEKRGEAAAR